jgi:uncharacterized protein YdaU (DUF1376 family)
VQAVAEFPAMPLWTDRYLADTRHLTHGQHGAYLLLLMEAWRRPHCSLPNDDGILSRLACATADEWVSLKPVVMAFWSLDNRTKTWSQKGQLKERHFVEQKRVSNRHKALKRWNKTEKDDATAMPEAMPNACPDDAPTPTPTPTPTKEVGGGSAQAREAPEKPALEDADMPTDRDRVLYAMGLDHTGQHGSSKLVGGVVDMESLAAWKSDLGLTIDEIEAVIGEVMVSKATDPPSAFKYFNKPMARLAAAKLAKLEPDFKGQANGIGNSKGIDRHGLSASDRAFMGLG